MERIGRAAILVDGSRQLDFIQPFAVHRQDDGALVPVHAPDMKAVGPVSGLEAVEWLARIGPDRLEALRTAPRDIGEEDAAVVLHDVDLAVVRPVAGDAQGPERRPQSSPRVDAAAHFEPPVPPTVQPTRRQARRRIFRKLAAALPVAGTGLITRIGHPFTACFDDEEAIGLPCILRLVPLQLAVPHEPTLVASSASDRVHPCRRTRPPTRANSPDSSAACLPPAPSARRAQRMRLPPRCRLNTLRRAQAIPSARAQYSGTAPGRRTGKGYSLPSGFRLRQGWSAGRCP